MSARNLLLAVALGVLANIVATALTNRLPVLQRLTRN